ncbi:hypothetical protein PHLCEN_2v2476 [Hermanssonia centrifuga]|uniref:Uncharacterized protein n=1 Tax=Hermanssonia centrifuga TaxID=98765 RepID=A0A2R6RLT9_9APHY|nr:hypothetical protein PHLCEN_2v2476 [Hermanssonia centrifuga]
MLVVLVVDKTSDSHRDNFISAKVLNHEYLPGPSRAILYGKLGTARQARQA